jgi:hypothetical protein
MSFHDEKGAQQGGGVTEACRYNEHTACNNPRCACDCHTPQATRPAPPISEAVADPQQLKSCPKCNTKRPSFERFCRSCGTKLGSLRCVGCGQVCEPADSFCFSCGCPLTKGAAEQVAQVGQEHPSAATTQVVVPRQFAPRRPAAQALSEEPYDPSSAEQEVLAALQRKTAQGNGPKEHLTTDVGRTFSLPQGTFKVSGNGPQAGGIHKPK